MTQKAPILILEGSKQPYLSIGRHYGAVKAFGAEYTYLKLEDAFLRDDYMTHYHRFQNDGKIWADFVEFVKGVRQ